MTIHPLLVIWLLIQSIFVLFVNASSQYADQRFHVNTSNKDAAVIRIGLQIHSINEINFKQSTFKATLSLIIVVEKSKRSMGSSIVRHDQYQYPFSDIIISSKSQALIDDYRLVTTTHDGTTSSQSKYNVEIYCPYQLKNYPFDTHQCDIDIVSVRHPLKQLTLKWIDSSEPRLSSGISTPNLVVQSAVGHYCEHDSAYSLTGFNAPHAQFGCVRAKLIMSRPLYIPLIRFFLPSILAIFISWSSIYINRNQIQTRLTVLIFSTSIICFIIFNAYSDMPTLVYLTAADIWLIICSIFLSISFVEFLIVQMLTHLSQKYRMLADKDTLVRKESRYRHEKRALRNAFVNMNASPKVPVANGRIFDKKHEVHFEIQPSSSSISNSDVIIYQHFRQWADYLSIMAARVDLGARIILPILFSLLTFLYFLFWIIL